MGFLTRRVAHDFLDTCSQIDEGRLDIVTPEGHRHSFGNGGGAEAEMVIHDWSTVTAIAARGDVGLGETYVAGLWTTPSIEALGSVAIANLATLELYAYPNRWNTLKFRTVDRILRANSIKGAARNISSHYDTGNEFYQLWLDEGMSYSSAIFAHGDNDLTRAQNRKLDRVLSRLGSGESVLEVGCGWGSFAERAAEAGRNVTGITISKAQKGYADARLDGRAAIELCDYRNTQGTYDNIVSIEMIEAVGERYWPSYFAMLKQRLASEGRAVIQAITVPDSYFDIYRSSSDFIRQYTFPGGMLLSDAVIADEARRAGLKVTQSYAFGQDYAQTLRIWSERMEANVKRIKQIGYSDAHLRSWQFYLQMCAAAFGMRQTDVVQVELSHAHKR
ncbi:SAM-dependent methyltransferase [Lentibacter sp. XHP0401]|jgi:cyclopropane-fatty-acyl-phospholipid synthase|uniref:SAM-dependent methyltransferase n=1 Tax=Lentibacter sp. XHP0401 TaxID=2984334 RepID=UPI0021E8BC2D|nr:cyclopropane-fatty-acyl-phospholipid synthase family protein [Lentibacter sp. XHP0401]MCV2894778.1 cyclopropane-fatty-acyl-phospholipid synthase family protein [Lentibacter sp. XHP0401]